ncbi:hypothetical protein FHU25_001966 [Clostridium saccharobutylicum]|nr:hypothetical protein [Clostridium saccharobutylicum]
MRLLLFLNVPYKKIKILKYKGAQIYMNKLLDAKGKKLSYSSNNGKKKKLIMEMKIL